MRAIGLHIEAVKSSAIMRKFGGSVSLKGNLQSMRIDIVDSESGKGEKGRGKSRTRRLAKFQIDTGFEMPALYCDAFSLLVGMRDIVDFEKDKCEEKGDTSFHRPPRNFRWPMDHLEAKPTTTKVNLSVNCNAVTPHVNMPLLRLIHQVVTMVENIYETRDELKQGPLGYLDFKTHRKQGSNGSSGTNASGSSGTEGEYAGNKQQKSNITSVPLQHSTPDPQSFKTKSVRPTTPLTQHKRPDLLPFTGKFPLDVKEKILSGSDTKYSENTPENPSDIGLTPQKSQISDLHDTPTQGSVNVEVPDTCTSSPAVAEKTIVEEIKENTPKCWRTMYQILDLYSTMPETKTVQRKASSKLSVIDEEPEKGSDTRSPSRQGSSKFSSAKIDQIEAEERQPLLKKSVAPRMTASFNAQKFTQSKTLKKYVLNKSVVKTIRPE